MPFNGSGTFSLTNPPITYQSLTSSADINEKNADIVTGLNTLLPRDGQAAATANLPMGGFKHTGVAAGTVSTDYARLDQIQQQAGIWCGTAGGTADDITLTPTPAITSLVAGMVLEFKAAAINTGAMTVAVSGLTPVAITSGTSLRPMQYEDISTNEIIRMVYDGTAFVLATPRGFFQTGANGSVFGWDAFPTAQWKQGLTLSYVDSTTMSATWTYPYEFNLFPVIVAMSRSGSFSSGGSSTVQRDLTEPRLPSAPTTTSAQVSVYVASGNPALNAGASIIVNVYAFERRLIV